MQHAYLRIARACNCEAACHVLPRRRRRRRRAKRPCRAYPEATRRPRVDRRRELRCCDPARARARRPRCARVHGGLDARGPGDTRLGWRARSAGVAPVGVVKRGLSVRAPALDVAWALVASAERQCCQCSSSRTQLAPQRHTARTGRVQGRLVMTRFTSLFSALVLGSAVAGAAVAACGGRPGAPAEMPKSAPPPDLTPTAAPIPGTGGADSSALLDAGVPGPGPAVPGSLRMRTVAFSIAALDVASSGGAPRDAGDPDSYTPPLPPVPDAKLPIDANAQPSLVAR